MFPALHPVIHQIRRNEERHLLQPAEFLRRVLFRKLCEAPNATRHPFPKVLPVVIRLRRLHHSPCSKMNGNHWSSPNLLALNHLPSDRKHVFRQRQHRIQRRVQLFSRVLCVLLVRQLSVILHRKRQCQASSSFSSTSSISSRSRKSLLRNRIVNRLVNLLKEAPSIKRVVRIDRNRSVDTHHAFIRDVIRDQMQDAFTTRVIIIAQRDFPLVINRAVVNGGVERVLLITKPKHLVRVFLQQLLIIIVIRVYKHYQRSHITHRAPFFFLHKQARPHRPLLKVNQASSLLQLARFKVRVQHLHGLLPAQKMLRGVFSKHDFRLVH
mmetsp:Transcript_3964/g.8706  ORF Transcript_3964/g.8706 Transcript_3964/m.8706 type:complete len:324 (+) Transcript_3964:270-1241(+)